ncbi:hypothetical protein [Streptomyces sp. NBC_01565]|uniref:hypothetical protein n=1 Tax=unclassified Streptomyces TaxID=2593676 RepID=UPI002258029A|nr:hypothetical protein [Streptomyces sp. NBC_01565]MCX4546963.1 lytic polysaccharide monooxygenase [Streptomyces sp. NBC_01565]
MLADYPWNDAQKYLEYRKFFEESTLASAGNPAFHGLDLAPGDTLGDWPLTELDTSAPTQTFTYDYMAYHQGEPTPFLVEVHGSPREGESTSWEFASLPRRTGRAAIVSIWGGHGGPDTPTARTAARQANSSCPPAT